MLSLIVCFILLIFLLLSLMIYVQSTDEVQRDSEVRSQLYIHDAKALVLTCIDFRLLDDVVHHMNNIGYQNNYDQFILAGSSLGYNQDKYPAWKSSLIDHINLAIDLHHISEIIVIDHLKCGAYKIFYGDITDDEELELHKVNLRKFKFVIGKMYPDLKISTSIMDLKGKVFNLE